MALTDALDELVSAGVLSPTIAMKVLCEFDRCISKVLQSSKVRATIKGKLHTYRFCGNVWTFIVQDALVSVTGTDTKSRELWVSLLKVVACDGKLGGALASTV